MPTWNGITFDENSQGLFSGAEPDYVLDQTVTHRPASNNANQNDTGLAPLVWEMPIVADRATITSLQRALGSYDAISWRGPSYNTTLVGVVDVRQSTAGDDVFYAKLRWFVGEISRLNLSVQLDTAVFPGHAISDITSDIISIDIDLGVDIDNGSAAIQLARRDSAIDERVRLYVYAGFGSTSIIFNGEITAPTSSTGPNDYSYNLSCQDAMARLREKWTLEDRTYTAVTEQSVMQNLTEAAQIDVSLTHIEGTGDTGTPWLIGVAQSVVLRGGVADPVTGDPGAADVPLDLMRKIDESTPLYKTYSGRNGAVYRRLWTDRTAVADFSDGSGGNMWACDAQRDVRAIRNACLVKGLTIAGEPLSSLNQATSPYVTDPPKYQTRVVDSYLIEDQSHADLVSAAYVAEENGRLVTVTLTTLLRNDIDPADCITITSAKNSLSSQLARVKHIHHHIDGKTATTQITAEFRD